MELEICKKCGLPRTSDPVVQAQQATCGCTIYVKTCSISDIVITPQHAHSLRRLVGYFKTMIETRCAPAEGQRSDALTMAYCDELLEGLKG